MTAPSAAEIEVVELRHVLEIRELQLELLSGRFPRLAGDPCYMLLHQLVDLQRSLSGYEPEELLRARVVGQPDERALLYVVKVREPYDTEARPVLIDLRRLLAA